MSETEQLIIEQLRELRNEQKQFFEHITQVQNELKHGNDRFEDIEKDIKTLTLTHHDCIVKQPTFALSLDYLVKNLDDFKDVLRHHKDVVENKKDVYKQVRTWLIAGVLGIIGAILLSGFGAKIGDLISKQADKTSNIIHMKPEKKDVKE